MVSISSPVPRSACGWNTASSCHFVACLLDVHSMYGYTCHYLAVNASPDQQIKESAEIHNSGDLKALLRAPIYCVAC